jgi:hypothetical protein
VHIVYELYSMPQLPLASTTLAASRAFVNLLLTSCRPIDIVCRKPIHVSHFDWMRDLFHQF